MGSPVMSLKYIAIQNGIQRTMSDFQLQKKIKNLSWLHLSVPMDGAADASYCGEFLIESVRCGDCSIRLYLDLV